MVGSGQDTGTHSSLQDLGQGPTPVRHLSPGEGQVGKLSEYTWDRRAPLLASMSFKWSAPEGERAPLKGTPEGSRPHSL